MVFHYQVGEYVAAWLKAAQIDQDTKTPLFRAFTRTGAVSERPLVRRNVFDMIKRRVKAAGLPGTTTYHTFRATGITTYLEIYTAVDQATVLLEEQTWKGESAAGVRPAVAAMVGRARPPGEWLIQEMPDAGSLPALGRGEEQDVMSIRGHQRTGMFWALPDGALWPGSQARQLRWGGDFEKDFVAGAVQVTTEQMV